MPSVSSYGAIQRSLLPVVGVPVLRLYMYMFVWIRLGSAVTEGNNLDQTRNMNNKAHTIFFRKYEMPKT